MKVTDLKENEVIHCETLEQYDAICQLLHEAGLRWCTNEKLYPIDNYDWCLYEIRTCLRISKHGVELVNISNEKPQNVIPFEQIEFPQTKEEYAKERAIGFAEWAAIEYKYFVSKDNDYWVSSLNNYTTAELYDEYLKSINHE